MPECPHCHELMTVLPSGVVVVCACPGSRAAEVADRQRRAAWGAERERALDAQRLERQRGRR